MGTQPVAEYCREIETYLCRKNDGHLIRVVGPSFELVSGWAARGVPLKIAFKGIDRYFERYYRKGPRRRPVRIDFCEADVLDVFDEWRRAVGVVEPGLENQGPRGDGRDRAAGGRQSLPAHLARVVTRLTSARASGALDDRFDTLIDRVAGELEAARSAPGGIRGEARRLLVERLADLDAELVALARSGVEPATLAALTGNADVEVAPFRAGMTPESFAHARRLALDRIVRERLGLPVIALS